eukprot:scaffold1931_cov390-Prasinococcus_capsulatus_cf.AAC.11
MSAAARGQPELEVVLSQERPKRVHKPPSRFDDSTTDQSSQPQIPAPSVAANVKGTTKEMERAEDHTDSSKSLLPGARLTRDQCTSKLRGQQILVYWPDDRNWYLAQVQDVTATKISLWYPPDADDSDAEDDEGWEEVMDIADGVRQQLLALRSTSGAIVSKKAQPAVRVEKKKSAKVAPQAQPGKPTELGPPRVADSGKTGAGSSKAASDIGHILGVASTESKKTGTKEVLDPKELKQFGNWKGCTEEGRNIRRKVRLGLMTSYAYIYREESAVVAGRVGSAYMEVPLPHSPPPLLLFSCLSLSCLNPTPSTLVGVLGQLGVLLPTAPDQCGPERRRSQSSLCEAMTCPRLLENARSIASKLGDCTSARAVKGCGCDAEG